MRLNRKKNENIPRNNALGVTFGRRVPCRSQSVILNERSEVKNLIKEATMDNGSFFIKDNEITTDRVGRKVERERAAHLSAYAEHLRKMNERKEGDDDGRDDI